MSATGGKLVIALRTEVEVALHVRRAGRAARDDRLAQQEVEHRADAARHDEAENHPEARTHRPAGSVPADIAHHQEVKRDQQAPGKIEVDAKSQRWRRMGALFRQNPPEVVLHQHKGGDGHHHRPRGNHVGVFVDGNRLWIAHGQTLAPGGFQDI
jgi:hypothetical protein